MRRVLPTLCSKFVPEAPVRRNRSHTDEKRKSPSHDGGTYGIFAHCLPMGGNQFIAKHSVVRSVDGIQRHVEIGDRGWGSRLATPLPRVKLVARMDAAVSHLMPQTPVCVLVFSLALEGSTTTTKNQQNMDQRSRRRSRSRSRRLSCEAGRARGVDLDSIGSKVSCTELSS